jgi:NifB/MoaA-like Fe-S oxidoreductase
LKKYITKLNDQFGTELEVEGLENSYFGGDVSVAGLLTGQDLLAARERITGNFIVIPKQMLKSDEPVMLDGLKLSDVEQSLGIPVHAVNLEELTTLLLSPN